MINCCRKRERGRARWLVLRKSEGREQAGRWLVEKLINGVRRMVAKLFPFDIFGRGYLFIFACLTRITGRRKCLTQAKLTA